MIQDLAERQHAEPGAEAAKADAMKREAAQRYRFLADAVPLVIWTARPDGHLDYYNKAWFDYTGLTPAQTEESGWRPVLHPDDLPRCNAQWAHSLATGEDYEIEYRFKRGADGAYRWFLGRASARRNATGEILQWVGTCTDIDDQKQVRSDLERNVVERTAELAESNAALRGKDAERELAGSALLETKRFLQSTLDALSAHIAILDEHGTIIKVNEAWSRFARDNDCRGGWCGAGENYLAVCDAAHGGFSAEAGAASAGIRAVIAGRTAEFHLEYPCHGPRAQRWFVMRATRFGGDGPLRVVVAHENITERKRAEAALQESEARYRSQIENAGDAIFTIAADGTFTALNHAVETIAGISRADWIGRPFVAMVDPADLPVAQEMVRRTLHGEPAPVHELRGNPSLPRPAIMEMTLAAQRDRGGKINGIIGIGRDVTARKQAEAGRARLVAILEATTDLVGFSDPAGRLLYLNRAGRALLGFGADEDISKLAIGDLIHRPTDNPTLKEGVPTAIRQGTWSGETVLLSRLGREIPVSQVILAHKSPDGKLEYLSTIMRDITARKQAEAALEMAHREMIGFSRQAGMAEIAIGVLHNVGNVLNSVNVSATLIADQVRQTEAGNLAKLAVMFDQHQTDLAAFLTTDPRGRIIPGYLGTLAKTLAAERTAMLSELDQLRQNIDHIKEIVAMQQTYARPAGAVETFSVPDLIEEAVRIDAESLARHDVETVCDYPVRPTITTDKHGVMEILINLLRNAKQACDESGHPHGKITVCVTGDDRAVTIAISDDGIGIPAENLGRIFNFGFTTRKNGHGFGLHNSALVAGELGGSLRAQSAGPGRGATFTLELPGRPDPARP